MGLPIRYRENRESSQTISINPSQGPEDAVGKSTLTLHSYRSFSAVAQILKHTPLGSQAEAPDRDRHKNPAHRDEGKDACVPVPIIQKRDEQRPESVCQPPDAICEPCPGTPNFRGERFRRVLRQQWRERLQRHRDQKPKMTIRPVLNR